MNFLVTLHDDGDFRVDELIPELQNAGLEPLLYEDEDEIIRMISQFTQSFDALDFICHGSQTTFAATTLSTVDQFGESLTQTGMISSATVIYLDGCNTGLASDFDGPIAKYLADACGCTVYGSQGYITTGAIALGAVECFASTGSYPSVPGSKHLYGDDVWLEFKPGQSFLKSKRVRRAFVVQVGYRRKRKQGTFERAIKRIIRQTLSKRPISDSEPRLAPDILLDYKDENRVFKIEVLANGGVLRDQESRSSWRVSASRARTLRKSINMLR